MLIVGDGKFMFPLTPEAKADWEEALRRQKEKTMPDDARDETGEKRYQVKVMPVGTGTATSGGLRVAIEWWHPSTTHDICRTARGLEDAVQVVAEAEQLAQFIDVVVNYAPEKKTQDRIADAVLSGEFDPQPTSAAEHVRAYREGGYPTAEDDADERIQLAADAINDAWRRLCAAVKLHPGRDDVELTDLGMGILLHLKEIAAEELAATGTTLEGLVEEALEAMTPEAGDEEIAVAEEAVFGPEPSAEVEAAHNAHIHEMGDRARATMAAEAFAVIRRGRDIDALAQAMDASLSAVGVSADTANWWTSLNGQQQHDVAARYLAMIDEPAQPLEVADGLCEVLGCGRECTTEIPLVDATHTRICPTCLWYRLKKDAPYICSDCDAPVVHEAEECLICKRRRQEADDAT